MLRIVAGLVILVFFTFYVSSGMVAGGVFMQSSFGTDYRVGLLIIAGVTVAYTLVGGFLAVSYTDFAQGLLLFVSLLAVPIVGLIVVGGPGAVLDGVRAVDAAEGINRLSLVQNATLIGVVSALAWGLGYFGQPHIIVRFMAIRSIKETVSGRRIGIGWMIFTLCGAIGTALVGVAYFHQHPELTITDPETVFIALGRILFHPVLAGFMLAAVLAAIMSTVSSQLLVSASALVEDIGSVFMRTPRSAQSAAQPPAVLTVSLIAGVLAWEQDKPSSTWSPSPGPPAGAAFGPTVPLSLWRRKLTAAGAIAGMITGAAVVGIWGNAPVAPVACSTSTRSSPASWPTCWSPWWCRWPSTSPTPRSRASSTRVAASPRCTTTAARCGPRLRSSPNCRLNCRLNETDGPALEAPGQFAVRRWADAVSGRGQLSMAWYSCRLRTPRGLLGGQDPGSRPGSRGGGDVGHPGPDGGLADVGVVVLAGGTRR